MRIDLRAAPGQIVILTTGRRRVIPFAPELAHLIGSVLAGETAADVLKAFGVLLASQRMQLAVHDLAAAAPGWQISSSPARPSRVARARS